MISDFVKGKKKFEYAPGIQKGIALHRAIDTFTDTHAATREAKEIFRPHYRLYSGAFVDVVYDHFLARDPAVFSENSLLEFTREVYDILQANHAVLPPTFQRMLPYMQQQNWLFHYRSAYGTEKSLGGLVRRAAYLEESDTAFALFGQHYQLLEKCYRLFWTEVHSFAREEFEKLVSE